MEMPDKIYVRINSDENVWCDFVAHPEPIFTLQNDTYYHSRIVEALKAENEALKAENEKLRNERNAIYLDIDYNSPLRPKRLEYTMCGKIYAVQNDGSRHMFLDVRGWGYLTGGGSQAKGLSCKEAEAIQDKWALEVVDLWNSKEVKE